MLCSNKALQSTFFPNDGMDILWSWQSNLHLISVRMMGNSFLMMGNSFLWWATHCLSGTRETGDTNWDLNTALWFSWPYHLYTGQKSPVFFLSFQVFGIRYLDRDVSCLDWLKWIVSYRKSKLNFDLVPFRYIFVWKYIGDLKYRLVWISNGQKQGGLQMIWISSGFWNPEAQTFEIPTNGRHFVKNPLNFGQKCTNFEWSGQKCTNFEWSGFWMVGTIAKARTFENQTIWNLILRKYTVLNVSGFWISDPNCRFPLAVAMINLLGLSVYNGDLNTELVWFSNCQKDVGCQMVWFSNFIRIPDSPTIWILDK